MLILKNYEVKCMFEAKYTRNREDTNDIIENTNNIIEDLKMC